MVRISPHWHNGESANFHLCIRTAQQPWPIPNRFKSSQNFLGNSLPFTSTVWSETNCLLAIDTPYLVELPEWISQLQKWLVLIRCFWKLVDRYPFRYFCTPSELPCDVRRSFITQYQYHRSSWCGESWTGLTSSEIFIDFSPLLDFLRISYEFQCYLVWIGYTLGFLFSDS